MLYAANFRHGTVDMFDAGFNHVKSFTDPDLPTGYAPFNVQVLGDKLFVTFALQDDTKHDDVAGKGNGFVDAFDLEGHMVDRVGSGGTLNSPWGLAIAPQSFGKFAGDLLVGNFGDGTINAFDPNDDQFLGRLGGDGKPIATGDLWALIPGNGGAGVTPTRSASPSACKTRHGLFGSLTPNPAPDQTGMMGSGATSGRRRVSATLHEPLHAVPSAWVLPARRSSQRWRVVGSAGAAIRIGSSSSSA